MGQINRRSLLGNPVTNLYRESAKKAPAELERTEQGVVVYAVIVLLIAMVFWLAFKNMDVGTGLSNGWRTIASCVSNPATCTALSQ